MTHDKDETASQLVAGPGIEDHDENKILRRPRPGEGDSMLSRTTARRRRRSSSTLVNDADGAEAGQRKSKEGDGSKSNSRTRRSKEHGGLSSRKGDSATAVGRGADDGDSQGEANKATRAPTVLPSTGRGRGGSEGVDVLSLLSHQKQDTVAAVVVESRRGETKELENSTNPRPVTNSSTLTTTSSAAKPSKDCNENSRTLSRTSPSSSASPSKTAPPSDSKTRKQRRSSSKSSNDVRKDNEPTRGKVELVSGANTKAIRTKGVSSLAGNAVVAGPTVAPSHDAAAGVEQIALAYSRETTTTGEDAKQSNNKPLFDIIPRGRKSVAQGSKEHETRKRRPREPNGGGRSGTTDENPRNEDAHKHSDEKQTPTHPADLLVARSSKSIVTNVVHSPFDTTSGSGEERGAQERNNPVLEEPWREAVPRRRRTSGDRTSVSRKKRSNLNQNLQGQEGVKETATDSSSALGLRVIDRGATKHLVLTASDTNGEQQGSVNHLRGAAVSSSGANCPPHPDVGLQHQGQHTHSRGNLATGPDEEERSRAFRNKLAAAVLARRDDVVKPPPSSTERQKEETIEEGISGTAERIPQAPAPQPAAAGTQHQAPEHVVNLLALSHKQLPQHSAASARSIQEMAPYFSVKENVEPQAPCPKPIATSHTGGSLPPGVPLVEDAWGGSPASTGSSSFPGGLVPERTAKYVQHQESFHADVSDAFADQDSPIEQTVGNRRSQRRAVRAAHMPKSDSGCISTFDNACLVGSGVVPKQTRNQSDDLLWPPAVVWTGGRSYHPDGSKSQATQSNSFADAPQFSDLKKHDMFDARSPREEIHGKIAPEPCREGGAPSTALQPRSGTDSEVEQDPEPRGVKGSSGVSVPDEDLVHFQSNFSRHLLSGERPALFFLRPHEVLAVTSIEGIGRLLVTLREEAGTEEVVVDGAVVHDSAAHFGHIAIQTDHRFPYVAGHRYEFQAVPAQGVELAVRRDGDRQETAISDGSSTMAAPIGLKVVFSVMSAYTKEARLCNADAVRLSLPEFEAPAILPPKATPLSEVKDPSPYPPVEAISKLQPLSQNSVPEDRPPSANVASTLIAPCLSPSGAEGSATAETEKQNLTPIPTASAPPVAPGSLPQSHQGGVTADVGQASVGESHDGELRQHAPINAHYGVQLGSAVENGQQDNQQRKNLQQKLPICSEPGGRGIRTGGDNTPVQKNGERYSDAAPRAVDSYVLRSSTQTIARPPDVEVAPPGQKRVEWTTTGGHSTGSVGWNPAWERQPSPTLPSIRRHVDVSPRSTFGQLEPGENRTPGDEAAAYRLRHRPYYARESIQDKKHVSAVENEASVSYRYRPAQRAHYSYDDRPALVRNATPLYRPGGDEEQNAVFSPLHGRRGGDVRIIRETEGYQRSWKRAPDRGDHLFPDRGFGGSLPRRKGGDTRASEGDDRTEENKRRWTGDDGWALDGPPELRRNAAHEGDGRQWGDGHRGDPRLYRFHYRQRASSLSDSHRYETFPPSESLRWEAGAPSIPRRAPRGNSGGQRRSVSTEEAHMTKQGYSGALAADRIKRAESLRERGGEEVAQHHAEPLRRKRVPQRAHHANNDPPLYRKPRHDSRGSGKNDGAGPTPPRWIKFC